MPVLLLLTGPSAGKRHELSRDVTLGRSPSCDIPLEDQKVSRRHAQLEQVEGQVRVSDLGSRNGTLLNGERIDVPVVLLPGDRVQVGDTTILFDPAASAAVTDRGAEGSLGVPLEDLLSVGGVEGLLKGALALAGAGSERGVLRRVVEWLRTSAGGMVAALAGDASDLSVVAVSGGELDGVEIPRGLLRAALERREVVRAAGELVAPLAAADGAPWGVLYLRRDDAQGDREARLAAVAARLAGEQWAALSAHAAREQPPVPVGHARAFRACLEKLRRCAVGRDSVCFVGERGTGRAFLARQLHARSARAGGPFVEVDCRRPVAELEPVLFGAPSAPGVPPRRSVLARADGGTLLLRELDALPRALGERLARLAQRLAAPSREERVDVRFVTTSGAAPDALLTAGSLDPELGQWLSGPQVPVPPLRERTGDVPVLLEALTAGAAPVLSPDAQRMLAEYAWPGNVSELQVLAARLSLLYGGKEVSALSLPPEFQQGPLPGVGRRGNEATEPSDARTTTLAERVSRLERDAISEALREARGKKIRAAEILGISRPTLDKKIADYGLVVEKVRAR
jgi:DNA-binding NtrC family response regulator